MSSKNSKVLFLPFQFGFLLYLFCCPIAVARSSNTMLNESGKGEFFLVLFMILEEMLSSFHHEYDVSYGFVTCGFYYVEVCSLYIHFIERFYHKWILSKDISVYWDDQMIFILQFVNMVYHIDWFVDIEQSLYLWDKSHIIMTWYFQVLLNFGLLTFFFATPAAYESSEARGWIRATAAGLWHRHSNARSEPRLQPTP